MKKLYTLLLFTLAVTINAQIVNIPDANFKAKLLSAIPDNWVASTETPVYDVASQTLTCSSYHVIDTNGDGEIQVSEAQAIKFLNVSASDISNLAEIEAFTNLVALSCAYNLLTALDVSQNTQLQFLGCSYNQLTALDVSQNTQLQNLFCSANQLTALDLTQNTQLHHLNFRINQLTALDVSQNTQLQYLNCSNNQLASLFIKNTIYYWPILDFSNNPNLQYICTNEENLAIIQQKINQFGYASTCHVNSYCSFTPGGTFYTIEGNNHFDGNANGCDSNDFDYPYLKFNVTDGDANGNFIANETGAYLYFVDAATYTLTPQLENPSYFNISPTSATIDFPSQASPFLQNFCITPNGVHHDLEIVIIPIDVARPGFDASYKIMYKNKGNQLENPTLTFAFNDAVMDFLNATVVPNNQDSGLLSWNLEPLAPLHSGTINLNFNLNSPMEIPALNSGDILNYTATISDVIIDETPANNVFTLNQEVVNSYDPNDKTCLEGETINPDQIGEFVHYQIRFENTGTYPAQNVVVKDMINGAKFDISTLQVINTSHSCVAKITGNKVEFIFENINLPFEDETNDGYIVFKIKTKPTLTINSTISNSASIYFDYNFPIITNTATSTYQVLANPSFNFEKEFTIHPNPVKNLLNIRAKNSLEIQSLEVYNTLGQLVIAKPNFEQTLDVSNLKTGTYFVKINTEKGSGNVKFVKE
jgi:hypothetical protein